MRLLPTVLPAALLAAGLVAASPATAVVAPTPTTLASVSTRDGSTVVIGADGLPYGTGNNARYQLGTGNHPIRTLTAIPGLPSGVKARAVVAGGVNVLVIGTNGQLYAAGSNNRNQIRAGATTSIGTLTPVEWLVGEQVVQADAYDDSIVAVLADGTMKGAGQNGNSRRLDDVASVSIPPTVLDALPGGDAAAQVSIAYSGTAVRSASGKVYTRGYSSNGQLASPSGQSETQWTEDPLPSGVTARSVDLGDYDLLILGSNGSVYGSGDLNSGAIGPGNSHDALVAIPSPGTGAQLVSVSTGHNHTVAIGDDGRLYGIGGNSSNQLPDYPYGAQNATYFWQPLASGVADDVVGASAGSFATVFVTTDGILYGSGLNTGANDYQGQITDGAPGSIEDGSVAMRLMTGQSVAATEDPVLTGTPQFSRPISVKPGVFVPTQTSVLYRWETVTGLLLQETSSPTFTPTSDLIGQNLKVTVIAQRSRFITAQVELGSTNAVAKGPALAWTGARPTITGTRKAGKTLRVNRTVAQMAVAFAPDAATVTCGWFVGSTLVSSSCTSYKIPKKYRGKSISFRATGAHPHHLSGVVGSFAVKIKK